MNDSPEKRDQAIARIMRDRGALPAASGAAAHGEGETDHVCPDAELLAAFADGGLPAGEAAQLERHFAACDRCREILALQTQASAEAMPVAAPPRRLTKRWLVPAVAAAAAVILWLALHPTPPVTQTVAQVQSGAPAPAESGTTSPAAAAPDTSKQSAQAPEIAEATVPPPPSYAGTRQASSQVRTRTLDELKKAPGSAGAAAPPPEPQSANEVASDEAKALPAPGADAPVLGVQTQAARDEFAAAARSLEAPPNGAQANNGNAVSGIGVGAGGGLGRVSAPATLVAPAAAQPTVFAAPDRSVFWRVGARGLLERSNDQGRTWQPQSSGVAAELLSGAAVSGQVAWVVGRGGVILRTNDGINWQRITSPAGPAADWTSVEAGDALNATIVSSDMRSFTTTDGGRSWTRQ